MSPRPRRVLAPLPSGLPVLVAALAARLQALPGIGEKAAQRHALHIALSDPELARGLGAVMTGLHDGVGLCSRCRGLAERPAEGPALCGICGDTKRDDGLLCVVARVQDMLAIERAGAMRGRYFVLGRLLSPLEGVGAEDLPLEELRARAADGVTEVLLALPASVDGSATAMVLARDLVKLGARVTRIAEGVAHGAELEWADPVTIASAITGRAMVT